MRCNTYRNTYAQILVTYTGDSSCNCIRETDISYYFYLYTFLITFILLFFNLLSHSHCHRKGNLTTSLLARDKLTCSRQSNNTPISYEFALGVHSPLPARVRICFVSQPVFHHLINYWDLMEKFHHAGELISYCSYTFKLILKLIISLSCIFCAYHFYSLYNRFILEAYA